MPVTISVDPDTTACNSKASLVKNHKNSTGKLEALGELN